MNEFIIFLKVKPPDLFKRFRPEKEMFINLKGLKNIEETTRTLCGTQTAITFINQPAAINSA